MKFLFKDVKAASSELKYEPLDDEITEDEIQSYENGPNGDDDIGEAYDDVDAQEEVETNADNGSSNEGENFTESAAPDKNGHKYII